MAAVTAAGGVVLIVLNGDISGKPSVIDCRNLNAFDGIAGPRYLGSASVCKYTSPSTPKLLLKKKTQNREESDINILKACKLRL